MAAWLLDSVAIILSFLTCCVSIRKIILFKDSVHQHLFTSVINITTHFVRNFLYKMEKTLKDMYSLLKVAFGSEVLSQSTAF
jgi:hypothetical protein